MRECRTSWARILEVCSMLTLAIVLEGHSTVAFMRRQGEESPLPGLVAGTSVFVRRQTEQLVRIICRASSSIAVARLGYRGDGHRNEIVAAGNLLTFLMQGEASRARPKGFRAISGRSRGGEQLANEMDSGLQRSLSTDVHGPGEIGETEMCPSMVLCHLCTFRLSKKPTVNTLSVTAC